MSGFAQFVAAALKDRALQDLLDENEKLVQENNRLRDQSMVRITGPKGTPIYYENSLANGFSYCEGHKAWIVRLPPRFDSNGTSVVGIPFSSDSIDLEICLGCICLIKIRLPSFAFMQGSIWNMAIPLDGPVAIFDATVQSRPEEPSIQEVLVKEVHFRKY